MIFFSRNRNSRNTINFKNRVYYCRRGSLYHFENCCSLSTFWITFLWRFIFHTFVLFCLLSDHSIRFIFHFSTLNMNFGRSPKKYCTNDVFFVFARVSNQIVTQWIKTLQMERPEEKNDITMIAWSGKTAGHGCFILQTLPYSVRMRTIEK